MKKLAFVLVAMVFCSSFPLLLEAQNTWTVYDTSNSGLPHNNVNSMALDSSGGIWAGTANGLAYFDGTNWTVYDTSNSGLPDNNISTIVINSTNTIFLGTKGGITMLDGGSWTTYDSTNSPLIINNGVHRVKVFDRNGDLWGITNYRDVFKFDGTSWEIYNSSNSTPVNDDIMDLSIDVSDNIWISPNDPYDDTLRLIKYDLHNWRIINHPCVESGLSTCRGFYIGSDASGVIWTSAEGGVFGGGRILSSFDGVNWVHYSSSNTILPNSIAKVIVSDNANVKWIGSTGLVRFDDTLWTIYNTSNSGIPSNTVNAIAIDAAGNKWIGTNNGLAKFSDGGAGPIEFTFSISGNILTETGSPIPGVMVTLSGNDTNSVTTDTSGFYSFNVEPGGNYTIIPSKSNDAVANNGISSIDILLMRRHILGTLLLSSPYKIIAAAEVNTDGDTTITTQDILFTRSLILGNITSFPTNRLWQFVSSDYVFSDTQHPFPFPSTRTYTNITANQTNQNFIGIKLGDVNGSWDANIP